MTRTHPISIFFRVSPPEDDESGPTVTVEKVTPYLTFGATEGPFERRCCRCCPGIESQVLCDAHIIESDIESLGLPDFVECLGDAADAIYDAEPPAVIRVELVEEFYPLDVGDGPEVETEYVNIIFERMLPPAL